MRGQQTRHRARQTWDRHTFWGMDLDRHFEAVLERQLLKGGHTGAGLSQGGSDLGLVITMGPPGQAARVSGVLFCSEPCPGFYPWEERHTFTIVI